MMRRRPREIAARPHGRRDSVDRSCCVAEVMGTDLFTLTPDTVVASALRLADTRDINHFLVVDDGSLTGIVCHNDLRGAQRSALVRACMTSPVLCISPETTLAEAAGIMEENSVGCLPVITGAFLVGMVTRERLSGISQQGHSTVSSPPKAKPVAAECVACGTRTHVEPRFGAGLQLLCPDCAGAGIAGAVNKGREN